MIVGKFKIMRSGPKTLTAVYLFSVCLSVCLSIFYSVLWTLSEINVYNVCMYVCICIRQGHWKCHYSIQRIPLTFYSNYGSILCRF